ncbi:MAG: hypothetical protein JXB24_13340 [Bacteroidales bacterium]|nr:hypothetical protein [Bacteroidales bacterium]
MPACIDIEAETYRDQIKIDNEISSTGNKIDIMLNYLLMIIRTSGCKWEKNNLPAISDSI